MILGLPLLLSLGCRPDPVYVVERVDGGGWVRTLSAAVAQESLLWQVEEGLNKRYEAHLADARTGPSEAFINDGGSASPAVLAEVT